MTAQEPKRNAIWIVQGGHRPGVETGRIRLLGRSGDCWTYQQVDPPHGGGLIAESTLVREGRPE